MDGQWITDPLKPNALISFRQIISHNSTKPYVSILKGFANAKNVSIAGDFNNWDPQAYSMRKDGEDWVFSVHLSAGKHLYKFIVDGEWILDPANKLWEQNEYGNFGSGKTSKRIS